MRGFDSVKQNAGRDSLREDELFDIYKLSKEAADTWITLRLLPGDILPVKKHWISLVGKDPKKPIRIPRMCVNFDPDSDEPLRGMKCPYCKIEHQTKENPDAPAQYDFKYLSQAIIRDLQEAKPKKTSDPTKAERKTGLKERGSKTWTPVRVVPLTKGNVIRINQLAERNMHKPKGEKKRKAFFLTDVQYGCDIEIKFRTEKGVAPGDRYVIEKGEHSPLTKTERSYLKFDFKDWEEIYDKLGRLDEKGALADYKKLTILGMSKDDDEDDDDGMSLGRRKKKKGRSMLDDDDDRPSKKKKRRSDDDDDDRPSKKKKRRSDDDDDDRPSKKKKKRTGSLLDDDDDRPSKKKKKSRDEDDDKPSKKKKRRDDDERPSKKKSSKSSKSSDKSSKKKSKK